MVYSKKLEGALSVKVSECGAIPKRSAWNPNFSAPSLIVPAVP
jgi:hypothetical protein